MGSTRRTRFLAGNVALNEHWTGQIDISDADVDADEHPWKGFWYSMKLDVQLGGRHTLRVGSEFHHFVLDDSWPAVPGTEPYMGPTHLSASTMAGAQNSPGSARLPVSGIQSGLRCSVSAMTRSGWIPANHRIFRYVCRRCEYVQCAQSCAYQS